MSDVRNSTTFRVSCVVNLTLQYDEALQVKETPDDAAVAVGQNLLEELAGTSNKPFTLAGSLTSNDASARRRRGRGNATQSKAGNDRQANSKTGAAASGGGPSGAPPPAIEGVGGYVLIPLTFGSDGFTVFTSRVPITGSFTIPHPREAGTFTLQFDFREFPIDPRLLRAVGVEIHLGTVSDSDYARGMDGQRDQNGRPYSILRTRTDGVDPTTGKQAVDTDTLVFYGTVDKWEVEHSEKSSVINLEGRDVRAIFIDTKLAFDRLGTLNTRQPINNVVIDVIKTITMENDFTIDVFTDVAEWPNGVVPSPGDVDGMTRVRSGAGGGQPKATPPNAAAGGAGDKVNYWDLITNYCALVGAVPYIRGTALWIRPARRIFDVIADEDLKSTAFAGGVPRESNGVPFGIRQFVYGRDLLKLKFDRKFAGKVVPVVECISIDDRQRGMNRLLIAQWPPKASPVAKAKADAEVLKIPVPGIRSIVRLTEIAHDVYEEIGRGETGGSAETVNSSSFGGDNTDPDNLRLRPGDPVKFVVDARALSDVSPVVSELNEASRRSFEDEVAVVERRLGDRDIARALVASARNAIPDLLSYYQVHRVQYAWSSATGIKIGFDFQNYILSRHGGTDDKPIAKTPSSSVDKQNVKIAGQYKKAQIQPSQIAALSAAATTSVTADADRQARLDRAALRAAQDVPRGRNQ